MYRVFSSENSAAGSHFANSSEAEADAIIAAAWSWNDNTGESPLYSLEGESPENEQSGNDSPDQDTSGGEDYLIHAGQPQQQEQPQQQAEWAQKSEPGQSYGYYPHLKGFEYSVSGEGENSKQLTEGLPLTGQSQQAEQLQQQAELLQQQTEEAKKPVEQ